MRKWHNFVNEQKDSDKVAKIVLLQGDKILFLISGHGPFEGQLDFPGGHLHYNEDISTGLQREVKEETNLVIHTFHKIHENGRLTFFWGNLPAGTIRLSDEHSSYELKTLDEINKKGYKISELFVEAAKIAVEEAIKF